MFFCSFLEGASSVGWGSSVCCLLHERAQTLDYEGKSVMCASKCQIILESGIIIVKSKCMPQI